MFSYNFYHIPFFANTILALIDVWVYAELTLVSVLTCLRSDYISP